MGNTDDSGKILPIDNEIENLVDNKISEKQDPPSPREGSEYDPRPSEDRARRNIAYLLIGLLTVVTLLVFALLANGTVKVSEIKEFGVILSPLITLVSAATGFYYGTKSN